MNRSTRPGPLVSSVREISFAIVDSLSHAAVIRLGLRGWHGVVVSVHSLELPSEVSALGHVVRDI